MWVIMEGWWRWQQWCLSSVCPVFLHVFWFWSTSEVGWPSIMHYSLFPHLGRNQISRVVKWSRVGFELKTSIFWSSALSLGVIAFKLWHVEVPQKLWWWVGTGGRKDLHPAYRSTFVWLIYRTLYEVSIYKRVLAFSVWCNKALPKCSYYYRACTCGLAGVWLGCARLPCCRLQQWGSSASRCRRVGQPARWPCSTGLSSLLDQWVSQGMFYTSSSRLRLGASLLSLLKQVTWPSPKSRG